MEDKYAGMIAAVDQMMAFFPVFTKLLFSYYENALDAGFNPEQALRLTIAYQKVSLDFTSTEEED